MLVSFGFTIIAFNVFLSWGSLTRGAFGIAKVPRPVIGGWVFDGELEFLLLCMVVLAVRGAGLMVDSHVVVRTGADGHQGGRAGHPGIRGTRPPTISLPCGVMSAMMAGLAGGLFSSWTSFIDPNSFILLESVLLVSIVILGGLASIWGSLLGAMAFVLLEEGMRFVPYLPTEYVGQARQVVLGILLVALMLFRPQGLVGRYKL